MVPGGGHRRLSASGVATPTAGIDQVWSSERSQPTQPVRSLLKRLSGDVRWQHDRELVSVALTLIEVEIGS